MILNDTWADGTRDDSDLPDESAWYAQSASSLVAGISSLTGTANATSSRLWLTYFTGDSIQPIQVPDGQMLKITLEFTPNNVAPSNNNRGVRLGLFDYGEGERTTTDFSSSTAVNGYRVQGYMLTINFSPVFAAEPIQVWARTDLANSNLMGTTAAFTSLGTGGGAAGDPGFSNDVLYTLEFTVLSRGGTVDIGARFLDTNGWNISHTVTDTNASFVSRFDAFAIRWERPEQTAASVTIKRFKVELVPPPFRIASIERLSPDSLKLTWPSVPAKMYEVQVSDNLEQIDWIPLGSVTADGTSASFSDFGILSSPQRFYRVVEIP